LAQNAIYPHTSLKLCCHPSQKEPQETSSFWPKIHQMIHGVRQQFSGLIPTSNAL